MEHSRGLDPGRDRGDRIIAVVPRGGSVLDWRFYSGVVFVCVAVGSFLYKRAQLQGIRPGTFMVAQTFCFFLTVLLASLLKEGGVRASPYMGWGVLAGTLGFTGAFSTLTSMKRGELGTNIAVVRLSFAPTAFGAMIFLGEPLTLRKAGILVLAGLAVFLFFEHYRRENRPALGSLLPALTACMAFGMFDIVYKYASSRGVNLLTFLIIQSGTAHVLANLYVLLREGYGFNRVILRHAPACGLLFASACLAWLHALREMDVSLLSPFIQMNFILSYLLAVVFFRESVTRRKLLGIVVVVLCLLLLSEGMPARLADLWLTIQGR